MQVVTPQRVRFADPADFAAFVVGEVVEFPELDKRLIVCKFILISIFQGAKLLANIEAGELPVDAGGAYVFGGEELVEVVGVDYVGFVCFAKFLGGKGLVGALGPERLKSSVVRGPAFQLRLARS